MNGEVIELFDVIGRPVGRDSRFQGNTALALDSSAGSDGNGGGGTWDAERSRALKQSVLADVACVLARSSGADIDARRAFAAARNLCEILFSHPDRPGTDIPKLFWETPLGCAVGACCGDREGAEVPTAESLVKTTIHLPHSVSEKLRLEATVAGKSVSDVLAEKLTVR